MNWENPIFTMNYSQPKEYRFSLDSVATPKVVADLMKNQSGLENYQVLDICSGCGVMGMELSFFLPQIKKIHFIEVQEIYKSHFEENVKTLNRPDLRCEFHLMNYEDLIGESKWQKSMDLVLANPPYFDLSQGKHSPSEFKNRCRFFIDSTFTKLIEAILWVLKPQGQAFILIRDLKDHSLNPLAELNKQIAGQARAEIVADIRGTHLVQLRKL